MSRYIFAGALIFSLLANTPVFSQDEAKPANPAKLTPFETTAKDFKFKTFVLGSELKTMVAKFPTAKKIEIAKGETKVGIVTYHLPSIENADSAFLKFFEEKLYNVIIIYKEQDLSKLGGGDLTAGGTLLFTKMTEKLGNPHNFLEVDFEKSPVTLTWDFKKVSKRMSLEFSEENEWVRLFYTDTVAEAKKKKKAAGEADTGF